MAADRDTDTPKKAQEGREQNERKRAEREQDESRRHFLVRATSIVGAVGVAAAAVPFIEAWEPSAAAKAHGAPVEVDIGKLRPGQMMTASWRRKPVFVLHRTQAQLKALPSYDPVLRDPKSSQRQQFGTAVVNYYRSIKPAYFVCVGICTHLGCTPHYQPQQAPGGDLGVTWKGGYFCPCHGSIYDLAGRVFKGVPAPLNLPVPPYYYVSDRRIRVGELSNGTDQGWTPEVW